MNTEQKSWHDIFKQSMDQIAETMTPSDWPRLLRRLFVITIPMSLPIYLVYFVAGAIAISALAAIWSLAEYLQYLWEK